MSYKITRKQAELRGLTKYYTGRPCPKGHICERYVLDYSCTKCIGIKANKRRTIAYQTEFGYRKWLLRHIKHRAKTTKIPFNLSIEDIIIPTVCPILNIPLKHRTNSEHSPTVDRIEPNKGYVKGNVAIISRAANTLKGHATAVQHRLIADWMDNHGTIR